jgi:hypothetical protein
MQSVARILAYDVWLRRIRPCRPQQPPVVPVVGNDAGPPEVRRPTISQQGLAHGLTALLRRPSLPFVFAQRREHGQQYLPRKLLGAPLVARFAP